MADEIKRFTTWTIVKALFSVVAIGAAVYGFNDWIDNKIEKHLNDPLIIRKITQQVQPFAIFSGTGTILVDKGAMDHVADLIVQSNKAKRIPEKVIIMPKRYMAHAPLITAIDQVGAVSRGKRGNGLRWIYTFDTAFILEPGFGPDKKTTAENDRYRLEIIE